MRTVYDLMTSDPDVTTPDTTLGQAITLMNRREHRQLPVVDAEGQLVGIITDRDIRLAVNSPYLEMEPVQKLHILEHILVEECMTPHPMTIRGDLPLYEVAGLMAKYKFGAMPVIEEDGSLVGIITVTDLLEEMALVPETQ